MWRNAGDYVKRWGAALIRGAATNAEFTVLHILLLFSDVFVFAADVVVMDHLVIPKPPPSIMVMQSPLTTQLCIHTPNVLVKR